MQNSSKYTATFGNYLLPLAEETHANIWVLQQDNASIHISKVAEAWCNANNINVMSWAAQMPDLNPIENV